MQEKIVKRLFDNSCDVIARRDSWDKEDFVFANWGREIENKDIPNNRIFDERLKHFLQGKPLKFSRAIFKFTAKDGVIEPFNISSREFFAQDWYCQDFSDLNTIKEWKDKGLDFYVEDFNNFKESIGLEIEIPIPRHNTAKHLKKFKEFLKEHKVED